MIAPLSTPSLAAIAITLISVNTMGAGAVRSATGATASPSAVPALRPLARWKDVRRTIWRKRETGKQK